MTGAVYLTAVVLHDLWQELDNAFRRELSKSKCGVQDFLKRRNPAWNLVGRVHFNLAENRKDEDAPFAFLATYTTRFQHTLRPNIFRSGKLCVNMRVRPIRTVCYRCFSPCNERPGAVHG